MPDILNFKQTQKTNLLLLGISGSGKTGALASLVDAGYNLRILDTDNGVETLFGVLLDPKSPYKKPKAGQIIYESISDQMKSIAGKPVPKTAKAWAKITRLLDHWKEGDVDLGPVSSWGTNDILVIDTLTTASKHALNWVLAMNSRLQGPIQQGDYFQAQQLVEGLVQTLYDKEIKCNVIINCHILLVYKKKSITNRDGKIQNVPDLDIPPKGYPETVGQALSPKIGMYFNHMLMVKTVGNKRKIVTTSQDDVELKTTIPYRAKKEYDQATGLAEYFKSIREDGEGDV